MRDGGNYHIFNNIVMKNYTILVDEMKIFREVHVLSKKNLNNESTKCLSELQKNSTKLIDKFLSVKTKDMIKNIMNDIYMNFYTGNAEGFEDKLLSAKNLNEYLKVIINLNKELKKENSYAMEKNIFETTQKVISDALKEQSQKKIIEILHYELF